MLPTPGGASVDENGSVDDEPTCMHTVVPVSPHAVEHRVPVPGVDAREVEPRRQLREAHRAHAARRRCAAISLAASSASHSGMMQSGMFTPIEGSHHSSTIQSLYASTHASASSLSSAS